MRQTFDNIWYREIVVGLGYESIDPKNHEGILRHCNSYSGYKGCHRTCHLKCCLCGKRLGLWPTISWLLSFDNSIFKTFFVCKGALRSIASQMQDVLVTLLLTYLHVHVLHTEWIHSVFTNDTETQNRCKALILLSILRTNRATTNNTEGEGAIETNRMDTELKDS